MKLSTLCYSLILVTMSSSVVLVVADFELQGGGRCGDANGTFSNSWDIKIIIGIDLATCQENCKQTSSAGGCMGVSVVPEQNAGPFSTPSQCYTYAGKAAPAVPVTTTIDDFGTPGANCYRYVSENTDPTPAPDDGCMVKKEKKYGYKDCGKLTKEKKCAPEALCEWKENNECAHVCDGKGKKGCKKPTFQGKKMCKFQK